jgi:hypothetical protein
MINLIRSASIAAALTLPLHAQSASFTFFGSASGETSFGQQLNVSGSPQLGTTFSVGVDYLNPPGACLQVITPYAVWLVLGLSNQSWLGVPLPLTLPQGFDLLVAADSVVQTAITSGTSCPPGSLTASGPSFPVPVPNNVGLLGLQVHTQILMARANVPPNAIIIPMATNGGTATIGL